MRRYCLVLVSVMLVGSVLAGGCASGEGAQDDGVTEVSQDESRSIARAYVVNSPTFRFDGMEETLELVSEDTLRCPYCWEFVFEFDSRHSGYGDRTNQALAQVITPHTARITVQEGEVVSAVMDGKWDMMKQELLPAGS
jgi:hypothetical protein